MGQAFARLKLVWLAVAAMFAVAVPGALVAQVGIAPESPVGEVAEEVTQAVAEQEGAYSPMAPTKGVGQPTPAKDDMLASMTFQEQYSETGQYALWMHDYILLPVITLISLFVLGLLIYVIVRYNKRANPVPSKTTHNTMIEVVWTIIPALILVVIAVPSITLLAAQYETPPEDAVTIKATGYQWYWTYTYPDHGEIEIVSNMLSNDDAIANGEPALLAVDNRMVVPADTPLRIQTTAADVIHAFSVPSLWFKQDAIPGRLNEKMIEGIPEGVYYGQCSELCGAKHGYMPIAVEALPPEKFAAWVAEQGGEMPGSAEAAPAAESEEVEAEAAEVALAE